MDDDSGPPRLSKRFSDNGKIVAPSGEVDYKTKAGTAWSHNFLNQKPWHPLSYPNQRRKWIAEQSHAQNQRRSEEVAREFAQEQEFFRQTALVSKKEKEKLETMKAVSFMYVRPPGYNPESAKAAEIADEKRRAGETGDGNDTSSSVPEAGQGSNSLAEDKKKNRPKDVFGRTLPTEEEFEVLKNAPRLDTGAPARVKPFAVEIRNVRCVRCGTYGHQSGDRECPLKDAIMPNDESRLKRDDPLTAIMAQTDSCEPLKWELKQRPGISPPRGGFGPDDPNQQIVADDIFDEYGGFLSGGEIPSLLTSFTEKKSKKSFRMKSKGRKHSSASRSKCKIRDDNDSPAPRDFVTEKEKRMSKSKHERKKKENWDTDGSNSSNLDRHHCRRRKSPSSDSDSDHKKRKTRQKHRKKDDSGDERRKLKGKYKERHQPSQSMSDDSDSSHHHQRSHSSDSGSDHEPRKQLKSKHKKRKHLHSNLSSPDNCDTDRRHRRRKTCHHPHVSKRR